MNEIIIKIRNLTGNLDMIEDRITPTNLLAKKSKGKKKSKSTLLL